MAAGKGVTGLNRLYYGDNLEVLRRDIATESVDLIYLDPPFNSNRSYNVLFKHKTGTEAQAQIEAFDDTWTWSQESEHEYLAMIAGQAPAKVADALVAMRGLLGENDLLAYLVMMTARLVELHRVLKPTGSLYLHCDPTASHYLKVMLDTIFGTENFRNEIIWKRTSSHNDAGRYGGIHDTILFYTKGKQHTWNKVYTPYSEEYIAAEWNLLPSGRYYKCENMLDPRGSMAEHDFMGTVARWRTNAAGMQALWDAPQTEVPSSHGRIRLGRNGKPTKRCRIMFLDEMPGVPLQSIWTDIPALAGGSGERLGYPTQKPLALLERIIQASSNPDDIVLDPFCGCGTAVDAAQKLGRRWLGIDITYLSIDLIDKRLRHGHGEPVADTYEVVGIPRDIGGARALFNRNPFEFERWAVSMVDGQPNEKQVGDRGIDGVIRYPMDAKGNTGRILVSVKGGGQLNPAMVRDLVGTVQSQKADMGVLITMDAKTPGMVEAANHSGLFRAAAQGRDFPVVQIITVEELLAGKRPNLPPILLPYIQAQRHVVHPDQLTF